MGHTSTRQCVSASRKLAFKISACSQVVHAFVKKKLFGFAQSVVSCCRKTKVFLCTTWNVQLSLESSFYFLWYKNCIVTTDLIFIFISSINMYFHSWKSMLFQKALPHFPSTPKFFMQKQQKLLQSMRN